MVYAAEYVQRISAQPLQAVPEKDINRINRMVLYQEQQSERISSRTETAKSPSVELFIKGKRGDCFERRLLSYHDREDGSIAYGSYLIIMDEKI